MPLGGNYTGLVCSLLTLVNSTILLVTLSCSCVELQLGSRTLCVGVATGATNSWFGGSLAYVALGVMRIGDDKARWTFQVVGLDSQLDLVEENFNIMWVMIQYIGKPRWPPAKHVQKESKCQVTGQELSRTAGPSISTVLALHNDEKSCF